jgi:hypothetical protein
VHVALAVAHDAAWVDVWKGHGAPLADDELRRPAADVDDHDGRRRPAGRSLVAPRKDSAASSSPGQRRGLQAEALAHLPG